VVDPDGGDAVLGGAEDHGADGRVEPGSVAATGEHADTSHDHCYSASSLRLGAPPRSAAPRSKSRVPSPPLPGAIVPPKTRAAPGVQRYCVCMAALPGLRVVRSSIHGYGVVATRDFAVGEVLAVVDGVLWHADEELDDRYSLWLGDDWFLDMLDQTRWINHSC